MEIQRLQEIGDELRALESRRRQLVDHLIYEIGQKHADHARRQYGELSEVTFGAARLLQEQREIVERAVGTLHLPGQPGHDAADTPEIGRAT